MAITTTPSNTQTPTPPTSKPPGSPRALIAITAVVILAALATAGYALTNKGGSTKPANLNTQPPPAASSPTVTNAPADPTTGAILAAYNKAYSVLQEDFTSNPVQPSDPRLLLYFTGAELAQYQNGMTIIGVKGERAVGTADRHPVVTSVDGATATVTDCLFDHSRIVQGLSGATVSGPDTKTTLEKVTMVLDGGTWKVSAQNQVGAGCVPAG